MDRDDQFVPDDNFPDSLVDELNSTYAQSISSGRELAADEVFARYVSQFAGRVQESTRARAPGGAQAAHDGSRPRGAAMARNADFSGRPPPDTPVPHHRYEPGGHFAPPDPTPRRGQQSNERMSDSTIRRPPPEPAAARAWPSQDRGSPRATDITLEPVPRLPAVPSPRSEPPLPKLFSTSQRHGSTLNAFGFEGPDTQSWGSAVGSSTAVPSAPGLPVQGLSVPGLSVPGPSTSGPPSVGAFGIGASNTGPPTRRPSTVGSASASSRIRAMEEQLPTRQQHLDRIASSASHRPRSGAGDADWSRSAAHLEASYNLDRVTERAPRRSPPEPLTPDPPDAGAGSANGSTNERAGLYNKNSDDATGLVAVLLVVCVAVGLAFVLHRQSMHAREITAALETKMAELQKMVESYVPKAPVSPALEPSPAPSELRPISIEDPLPAPRNVALLCEGAHILAGYTTPPASSLWWQWSQSFRADHDCMLRAPSAECWPIHNDAAVAIGLGRPANLQEVRLHFAAVSGHFEFAAYSVLPSGRIDPLEHAETSRGFDLVDALGVTQIILRLSGFSDLCIRTVEIIGTVV